MHGDAATRLHERLDDRFGDDVRSVCYYGRDGNDVVFVRDDVDEAYEDGDYRTVFRNARLEAMDRPNQESMFIHGDLQCSAKCFEDATELNLPLGSSGGVMVAMEAGAIDDLRGTIDLCLDVVAE